MDGDKDAQTEIVLEISPKHSNMYIYPVLHNIRVTAAIQQAWFGVYKANKYNHMDA